MQSLHLGELLIRLNYVWECVLNHFADLGFEMHELLILLLHVSWMDFFLKFDNVQLLVEAAFQLIGFEVKSLYFSQNLANLGGHQINFFIYEF